MVLSYFRPLLIIWIVSLLFILNFILLAVL